MYSLYETKNHYNAKYDAQLNLEGRTHYVSDETLRYHYSRIQSTYVTDNGLLFALIESTALDHQNRTRGFRYVIFNVFGHVISRVKLEDCFKTSDKARAAMWDALNAINAKKVTREGIKRVTEAHKRDMQWLKDKMKDMK